MEQEISALSLIQKYLDCSSCSSTDDNVYDHNNNYYNYVNNNKPNNSTFSRSYTRIKNHHHRNDNNSVIKIEIEKNNQKLHNNINSPQQQPEQQPIKRRRGRPPGKKKLQSTSNSRQKQTNVIKNNNTNKNNNNINNNNNNINNINNNNINNNNDSTNGVNRYKKSKSSTPIKFSSDFQVTRQNQSEYSKSRLRQKRSTSFGNINPLTLVDCVDYSKKGFVQPFKVLVHNNALIIQEVHAHLANSEIIGLLAGYWDQERNCLHILDAFACEAENDDSNNVEMKPESQLATQTLIHERELQVVGWYHSHPHFHNAPSLRDVENQSNYQLICEDQPFVGAILSPYQTRQNGFASSIRWFNTRYLPTSQCDVAFNLKINYIKDQNDVKKDVIDRVKNLLIKYQLFPQRVDLSQKWKNGSTIYDKIKLALWTYFPQKTIKLQGNVEKMLKPLKNWSCFSNQINQAALVVDKNITVKRPKTFPISNLDKYYFSVKNNHKKRSKIRIKYTRRVTSRSRKRYLVVSNDKNKIRISKKRQRTIPLTL